MFHRSELKCPFCGGNVRIVVCDREGNFRSEDYENDPWSGLGYMLVHDENDVPNGEICPIATFEHEALGTTFYDSREEAFNAWSRKPI